MRQELEYKLFDREKNIVFLREYCEEMLKQLIEDTEMLHPTIKFTAE